MSTLVHSRGGGGQNWLKFGPRSCWMPPYYNLTFKQTAEYRPNQCFGPNVLCCLMFSSGNGKIKTNTYLFKIRHVQVGEMPRSLIFQQTEFWAYKSRLIFDNQSGDNTQHRMLPSWSLRRVSCCILFYCLKIGALLQLSLLFPLTILLARYLHKKTRVW